MDLFDKIDDIIYKPVEAICDWVHEPLRKKAARRVADDKKLNAQIEADRKAQETQLEIMREREAAELMREQREWNAEIDRVIAGQEDARRDKLVEAIRRYQIELATAFRDIVESIGIMSLEMRSRANDSVLEKTKEYTTLQDKAKAQAIEELQQTKEKFAESDPETYRMLVTDILNERRTMVETAGRFITELSADLKRLNENTDKLMEMGMKTVDSYLKPLASAIGIATDSNHQQVLIEQNDSDDSDIGYIECDSTEYE